MIKTTICGNLVYDPELKTVSDEKKGLRHYGGVQSPR